MTDHDEKAPHDEDAKANESITPIDKLVRCRRTGRDFKRSDHQRCPYCYGSAKDIADDNHDNFCDYEPGVDPICYGFPGTTSRERRG